MFGYIEPNAGLDPEYLLNFQKELFELVLKEPIETGRKYRAPYREDKNPACYFTYEDDKLIFHDWSNVGIRHFDCFEILKICFSLTYPQALQFAEDYILNNNINLNKIVKYKLDSPKKTSNDLFISVRDWNKKDAKFWTSYKINKGMLEEDKVYPIACFSGFSKKTGEPYCINTEQSYAFCDFEGYRKKIYSPYNKEHKWVTNCNQNDVGGRYNSQEALLIISKSYKDYRVIKNQGLNSCWFQNEGMVPNDEILKKLVDGYSKIIVWFDNDRTGQGASIMVSNILNKLKLNIARPYTLPPALLLEGVKDPSDLIKKKGQKELDKIIEKII